MKCILAIVFCFATSLCLSATAQHSFRPADNAALRYWMAFAQMNDSPISAADAAQMDAIIGGKAPWNEQKFGPLVEQNNDAIETMIRGTKLPYCDWGIEYDLGPDAPIAYLPKARALARINRLYARHMASTGAYDAAIRATIAGIRFAQHMAQNASFFGALTAKAALLPQLAEATELVTAGHLSPTQLAALRRAVQTLPEGGFNWKNSARLEGWAIRRSIVTISESPDPKALYQTWFGNAAPETLRLPSHRDDDELDQAMAIYGELLGTDIEAANNKLPALQKRIATLNPLLQIAIPSPARMVAARAEAIHAQREAAEALGIK